MMPTIAIVPRTEPAIIPPIVALERPSEPAGLVRVSDEPAIDVDDEVLIELYNPVRIMTGKEVLQCSMELAMLEMS